MKILSSASKLVLLIIAITACICFYKGVLSENNFMILAAGVFAFYFSMKPTDANGVITK